MFIWIEVLRDLWRNKGRSLLILSFGLFMLSSMVLYVGNIQNNEIMLRQLSETIPVTVQVVGENGNQQAGLEIDQTYVDALLSGGVRDPHYTIVAGGNIDAKNQGQPIKFCDTSIVGINKSDSLSPVIREQTDFMQGWGDSFFSDDSAACIINANYALRHQISLGDTIEFPLYIWEYEEDNVHFRFIEVGNVSLLVVGTYTAGADIAGSDTGDVIVPIHWLQNYLSDSGIVYSYSSFQGTLADPLRLNDWKTQMKEVGFQEVDPESFREREGNALRVNDQLFIDTAEEIQENIRIYNGFQLPFFALLTISGSAGLAMWVAAFAREYYFDDSGMCSLFTCPAFGYKSWNCRSACYRCTLFNVCISRYCHCTCVPVSWECFELANKSGLTL